MVKFIEAVLILSGMIIGVGMFGIPFSFAKAGFLLGTLELLVLTVVMLVFHIIYADIVIGTGESHRVPGYVKSYLGHGFSTLAWFATLFGIAGTILVYIIIGTEFLGLIFRYFNLWVSTSLLTGFLVAVIALLTLFPLRKEALINGVVTAALIGFLILLSALLFPQISLDNIKGFDVSNIFFPYGVILFALSGGVAIPDLVILLERRRRSVRAAVVMGTLIPAVLYLFFALAVVGVAGSSVSEEAIRGLERFVGPFVLLLGGVIGFLAVFTSYLVLSYNFQSLLILDMGIPRFPAWFLASFIPLGIYLLGFQNFIATVGVIGAVSIGIESALLLAVHHIMKKQEGLRHSLFSYLWKTAIYGMLAIGVMQSIANTFF